MLGQYSRPSDFSSFAMSFRHFMPGYLQGVPAGRRSARDPINMDIYFPARVSPYLHYTIAVFALDIFLR